MIYKRSHASKWQPYQVKLKRSTRRKRLVKKLSLLVTIAGFACTILLLLFFIGPRISDHLSRLRLKPPQPETILEAPPDSLAMKDLTAALHNVANDSAGLADQSVIHKNGKRFFIRTTIDTKLQKYIVRMLERSRTLQSAVVVLNPYDGHLLSMVSHDADGNSDNLCLKADFPAASLFKIVTAAAAIESAGFTLDKSLFYQGRKHTLYKYQLKPAKGRYTTHTSFRKAFASSNNSVFGKIGIYDLGQNALVKYSDKFFFNKPITFDLPLAISRVDVPPDDFGLAEIASGFNKRTLISPLHTALLASVAVNNGRMPVPWLIESVRDESNKDIYQAQQRVLNTSISRKTAADLKILMEDAARYGTSRTAFRKLRRKKMFKHFDLGAKTGTINDRQDQFKYDWQTAFALSPDEADDICVGVLAVHGKILGTRAAEMARAIINYYFSSTRI